jgi:hypothetical protein
MSVSTSPAPRLHAFESRPYRGATNLAIRATPTRDRDADQFVSTILEGPSQRKVRPVAEIFYEEAFGQSYTLPGLIGAIWQVSLKDTAFPQG